MNTRDHMVLLSKEQNGVQTIYFKMTHQNPGFKGEKPRIFATNRDGNKVYHVPGNLKFTSWHEAKSAALKLFNAAGWRVNKSMVA